MRMRTILTTAAAVTAGLFAAGCGNTSNTGGGASKTVSSAGGAHAEDAKKDDTFTIKGPALATTLKQGEKKDIELTVSRGKDFHEGVKLTADAPKGLKVTIEKATVAASDPEKALMSVEAEKDAAVGDHPIKVTATPDKGQATSLDVRVKVDAAK